MVILPMVLAGGRSSRFGQNKLLASHRGGLLVDIAIAALRGVFGDPVALVGMCDAAVASRASFVIDDGVVGLGPIGGVMAGLRHAHSRDGVFVLAGDLADISNVDVRLIWEAAERDHGAWATLADSGRLEPCVGVYRPAALKALAEHVERGRRSLHDALPSDRVRRVSIDPARLRNVNTPADLLDDGAQ